MVKLLSEKAGKSQTKNNNRWLLNMYLLMCNQIFISQIYMSQTLGKITWLVEILRKCIAQTLCSGNWSELYTDRWFFIPVHLCCTNYIHVLCRVKYQLKQTAFLCLSLCVIQYTQTLSLN